MRQPPPGDLSGGGCSRSTSEPRTRRGNAGAGLAMRVAVRPPRVAVIALRQVHGPSPELWLMALARLRWIGRRRHRTSGPPCAASAAQPEALSLRVFLPFAPAMRDP